MSAKDRTLPRPYAMERWLAPHVDRRWAQTFMVELRLAGVDGTQIGSALSEVESHCAESGQSAEQSFGEPARYARSLQLQAANDSSTLGIFRSTMTILVQVVGMTILNWSFEDWLRGPRLDITNGQLVAAAFVVLGYVALIRYADPLLRTLVHHPIHSVMLTYLAWAAAFVVPLIVLDDVIWQGLALWGVVLGTAVLGGGVVWAVAHLRSYGSQEDPITSPFEQAGTSTSEIAQGSPRKSRSPSALVVLTYTAMIPSGTVILLATTVMIHQLSAG